MPNTTVIRNLSWIVAWDASQQSHAYFRNADLVFSRNTIDFVGKNYAGRADNQVDGRGLCALPGLVNIHSHPVLEPVNKGFADDVKSGLEGEIQWFRDFLPYVADPVDLPVCAAFALCEMLRSGVTTVVDISEPYAGWIDVLQRSGMRAVVAPMINSMQDEWWTTDGDHSITYRYAKDGGKEQLRHALDLIDRATEDADGRITGMVMPMAVDTCTPELIVDSFAAATERGIPMQIHAAQLITEFREIKRRHGLTPIQLLAKLGVLAPQTILSHAIVLDHHHLADTSGPHTDLDILAESGATVAHCAVNFARAGVALDSYPRYRSRGINIGIGTDSYPHNILEWMRTAAYIGRVVSRDTDFCTTADIFNSATISGARALQRDDIGRLAPGMKADIVLVDLSHPSMVPARDPLRSLIYCASNEAIRDVYVDGNPVLKDGVLRTLDFAGASREMENVRRRVEQKFPERDKDSRSALDVSPLTFAVTQ